VSAPVATLDVGSNSVTGLIAARGPEGPWRALEERCEITRLGRGLRPGAPFDPAGLRDTLAAIEAFASAARARGAEGVVGVATAAAREAEDGPRLVEAAARLGVSLEIISGDEEAALSWRASWRALGEAGRPMGLIDIGGRSTELAIGEGLSPQARVSLPLGAVRLFEAGGQADPPSEAAGEVMDGLIAAQAAALPAGLGGAKVVAVAGTATALGALDLALERYDGARVHGHPLSRGRLAALHDQLWALPLAERLALPGIDQKRADVLPAGARLLLRLCEAAGAEALTLSDQGVRWGLLERFGP